MVFGLLAVGAFALRGWISPAVAVLSAPGGEDYVLVSESDRTYHDLDCVAADSAFDADFRSLADSIRGRTLTIEQINVVIDSFLVERTGYTGMSFDSAVAAGYTVGSVC